MNKPDNNERESTGAVGCSAWLGRLDEWCYKLQLCCRCAKLECHIAFMGIRLQFRDFLIAFIEFRIRRREVGFKPDDSFFLRGARRSYGFELFQFFLHCLCFNKSTARSSGLTCG